MRPRFVAQHALAIPHPGWKGQAGSRATPPHIVVIAYIDTEGQPWLYDDHRGLHKIEVPDDSDATH